MTTGLHEREEYAISVCGKVFVLYRKAIFFGFLEYVLMCAIQKGYPCLVMISETSKISKMAALIRTEFQKIQNFQKGHPYTVGISKMSKMSEICKFPKFPKSPKFPKCPDLGCRISENIGGNFLEILEFLEISEFLEIPTV